MNRSYRATLAATTFLFAIQGTSMVIAQSCTSDCGTHASGQSYGVHGPVAYGTHGFPSYRYGYRPYRRDFRHGVADVIRSAALANVLNAQARTEHLQADRLQMENSVQVLATRLERKQINRESRFGHLHERGARLAAAKLVAAEQTPPRARHRCVDPQTGCVAWPMLLRSSYFEKARAPIDSVFRQRSEVGYFNPDHFLPMRDWIERIECELKANVAYYEMKDYLSAKDFLRSLVDEARRDLSPAEIGMSVASR